MELNDKLCYCFHVTKRKIVNHIRINEPKVPSQLADCGGAGTGCGWCVPYLKRCFKEANNRTDFEVNEITPEEYAQQRANYIRDGKGKPAPGAEALPDEE